MDRKLVVVANLAPRKMKFGMSEGMVLAAGPGGEDIFCSHRMTAQNRVCRSKLRPEQEAAMTEYLLILVSTILVNNFVLVQFLGLCPFMGFPTNWKPPWGCPWRRPLC